MTLAAQPTAAARLRAALTHLADSLAAGDLPAILDCELRVSEALDAMPADLPVLGAEGRAWREDLDACRAALLRCRRLGAALMDFTRWTLTPAGVTPYSRAGAPYAAERVGSLEQRV